MNMQTSRINISSLLVATMSVCACFFLFESQVYAQQLAAIKTVGSAKLAQENQSRQHAAINLLPLAKAVNQILTSQSVDLSQTVSFLIEADRNSEGALYNVNITQTSGDSKLKGIADEFVAALNDSRLLSFLTEAKHLRLSINSSKTEIAASASYKAESASRAVQTAHGYDAMFYAAAVSKRGRDEELIYKALKASSNSDEVTMSFAMPRETFCALLSKYLSSN